jgi:tetratricopeptide (TPR) repeat protein
LQSATDANSQAETDLELGIGLTQRGSFAEAIPPFLAAKGHVSDEYALEFNLALCYIGIGEFEEAIATLAALHAGPHEGAGVENLLAQAYAGNGQAGEAFDALQRAVAFTPTDEKLYLFVADAFLRRQEDVQSLRVIELGLQHLSDSARLHYERGYLLSMLDDLDGAKADFELAMRLAGKRNLRRLARRSKNLWPRGRTMRALTLRSGMWTFWMRGWMRRLNTWKLDDGLVRGTRRYIPSSQRHIEKAGGWTKRKRC